MHIPGLALARARWYAFRHRGSVTFGTGVRIRGKFRVSGRAGRLKVGDHVFFDREGGANHFHLQGGDVLIGSGSYINGLEVYATDQVAIGERATIGDVWITTTDFHGVVPADRWRPEAVRTGPVTVGSDVWLANRVAVLRGSTIGQGAVVGFGSVVSGAIPPRVVASGQSARMRRPI